MRIMLLDDHVDNSELIQCLPNGFVQFVTCLAICDVSRLFAVLSSELVSYDLQIQDFFSLHLHQVRPLNKRWLHIIMNKKTPPFAQNSMTKSPTSRPAHSCSELSRSPAPQTIEVPLPSYQPCSLQLD